MKPLPLDIDRIDHLALDLAMLSAQQAPDLVSLHFEQFRSALLFQRRSCQLGPLTLRFVHAGLSARPLQFLNLVERQRTMLRLAADDGSELDEIYEALKEAEAGQERFWLGQTATHKQKHGWQACEIPVLQVRYSALVRKGEVADAPAGLFLHRARQRRRVAYWIFALFVGWQWFIFSSMFLTDAIDLEQLIAYISGSLLLSLWLTRGLFVALRADQRTLDQVNKGLRLKGVAGRRRG